MDSKLRGLVFKYRSLFSLVLDNLAFIWPFEKGTCYVNALTSVQGCSDAIFLPWKKL